PPPIARPSLRGGSWLPDRDEAYPDGGPWGSRPMLRIDDRRRPWWVLAAMGAGIGLVLLDETVVGGALATIAQDLHLSPVASHWAINAYLLVFAGFVAAGGRLGDIIGLRTLFLGGVAVFGLLSLASGLAQDGTQLIAARALQGIGAAV